MTEMAWYIPPLIFLARICDVSIGTMRLILLIQGSRYWAAFLGFWEVIIWALAIGGMISFLSNPFALVAYAGGFATGTLVGSAIEHRIALGYRLIRVINANLEFNLSAALREHDYRVTRIEGAGRSGPVEIAFLVVRRRALRDALELVERLVPDAFVTVERADRASGAAFEADAKLARRAWDKAGGVRK
ncbi:MAG: DUF2179 domain-containing protein [Phycisphaerales bacterium]